MATRDYGTEIEAIKSDMTALRGDVQKLVKSFGEDQKNNGREAVQRIQEARSQAQAEINRLAQEAGARGREGVAAVEGQIEERPFTSVLAAFGIGLLIGKLLDRR